MPPPSGARTGHLYSDHMIRVMCCFLSVTLKHDSRFAVRLGRYMHGHIPSTTTIYYWKIGKHQPKMWKEAVISLYNEVTYSMKQTEHPLGEVNACLAALSQQQLERTGSAAVEPIIREEIEHTVGLKWIGQVDDPRERKSRVDRTSVRDFLQSQREQRRVVVEDDSSGGS